MLIVWHAFTPTFCYLLSKLLLYLLSWSLNKAQLRIDVFRICYFVNKGFLGLEGDIDR